MRRALFILLLLVAIGALGALLLGMQWQRERLQARLTLPGEQRVVVVGEPLLLTATASSGRAHSAQLWVNGAPTEAIASRPTDSPLAWSVNLSWRPEETGRTRLVLRLSDGAGHTVDSTPLDLDVVPDGTIAFTSNRSGADAIYTMRLDGRDLHQIVAAGSDPAWGAGGGLLYVHDGAIWEQSAPTREPTVLVTRDFQATAPAWRQRLAFASRRSGRQQVLLRDSNGALATLPGLDRAEWVGDPSWGPDGRELIVAARVAGNLDLYRVSLVAGAAERLTSDPADDWQPAWSPDGRAILFTSTRLGAQRLFWRALATPDEAAQPIRTTGDDGAELIGAEQASWSPLGDWFVFVAPGPLGAGTQARELFLQRFTDSYVVRLTNNAAAENRPAWRPPTAESQALPLDGFLGEFFPNLTLTGNPAAVQALARLDVDWGEAAPLPGLPADGFSARWRGRFRFDEAGDYRFTLLADDAARLWVDDTLLIDGWASGLRQPLTAPIYLVAGEHTVRVEYRDDSGPARLLASWERVP